MVKKFVYTIIVMLSIISPGYLAQAQEEKPVRVDSAERRKPVKPVESRKKREPVSDIKGAPGADAAPGAPGAPAEPGRFREIAAEFPCNAGATVFLENVMYGVHILTTNENMVRVKTTVSYDGKSDMSNEEWLKIIGLRISGTAENVVVESGNSKPSPRFELTRIDKVHKSPKYPNDPQMPERTMKISTIMDSLDFRVKKKDGPRREIMLFIPSTAKINIESRYGHIFIENKMGEVKARIDYANLSMKDADLCNLTCNYARIHTGNINNMKAEVKNGNFNGKKIDHLEIHSSNSTVEVTSLQILDIHSEADEYEIEEAGVISGVKNYGEFRVTSLRSSFDISGKNADIRIRVVEPSVRLVKIDNQYANLRLPLGDLKNYSIIFEGEASNTYTPFERKEQSGTSFKYATAKEGAPTAFNLKCNNCTVDFK